MSTKKLQIIGSLGGDSAKLDDTLTKEGFAADSKAVGDAIKSLNIVAIVDENEDGNIEFIPFMSKEAFVQEIVGGAW